MSRNTAATRDKKSRDRQHYVRFSSHRGRDYGLRALDRKPQSYFSTKRETGNGGVYLVTEGEVELMRQSSRHARFTILRPPYDDLMECWSIR